MQGLQFLSLEAFSQMYCSPHIKELMYENALIKMKGCDTAAVSIISSQRRLWVQIPQPTEALLGGVCVFSQHT